MSDAGIWNGTLEHESSGDPPLLVTTFRTELDYPRIVAYVAWFDHNVTQVAFYPGRYEPPIAAERGPMMVPTDQRWRLLATFNGPSPTWIRKIGHFANQPLWRERHGHTPIANITDERRRRRRQRQIDALLRIPRRAPRALFQPKRIARYIKDRERLFTASIDRTASGTGISFSLGTSP